MQELINRVSGAAGINAEQAEKAINTLKDFVKEKFPMMAGAVDTMFAQATAEAPAAPGGAPIAAAAAAPVAEEAKKEENSMLDKISDVIPGQAGEKVENFVKGAADKVEDVFDNVKDKLSGLFGGGDDKK